MRKIVLIFVLFFLTQYLCFVFFTLRMERKIAAIETKYEILLNDFKKRSKIQQNFIPQMKLFLLQGQREEIFEVTAYSRSIKEGTEKGITRIGLKVDHGVCAVDPKIIPLGSLLWIEDYGYAWAIDTGTRIKGKHIDVFFQDKTKAIRFGKRFKKVKILALPVMLFHQYP